VNRSANMVLCIVAALVGFGLVMNYSVSTGTFAEHPEQSYPGVMKHFICILAGAGAFWCMAGYRYQGLRDWWKWVVGLTVALLSAVLFLGTMRNGARRWFILYGQVAFQPSEVAKVAVPIFVAAYVSLRGREELRSLRGFLVGLGVVCVMAGLILLEPDFGTATLVGAVGLLTLVVFGVRPIYALGMMVPGAGLMVLIALTKTYMRERILMWIDPWRDPQGTGYHIIQSLIAIGSGGVCGKGLAWSEQKLWYLPEANTDFIFSIIGEEFGLCGSIAVIILFVLLLREGIRIAKNAPDAFGSALAFGITMMITVQAAFNIAVTTKSVPTKGISLPFISFGGSSMLLALAAVGILVNIARQGVAPATAPAGSAAVTSAAGSASAAGAG